MLTARDLLTETMERLFGKVTVRVNRFEGKGREPLGFSANYFCHECLRACGDTNPINSMAHDRIINMSRRVLAGKTDYDPWQFSNDVAELLFDLFGVETTEFAIDAEGDALRMKKASTQAALLSRMLRMAEGKPTVDEAAVAKALERTAEERHRAIGGFGPERFCYRGTYVGYRKLIGGVQSRLDVLHFCGQTWTNSNGEYLRRCLAKPGVEVRVGLLDPRSLFFAEFNRYKGGMGSPEKTANVLVQWREKHFAAARKAKARGAKPAREAVRDARLPGEGHLPLR